jgi:Flp pilus assembly protein TadG
MSMQRFMRNFCCGQRGSVSIITALFMAVLIGFLAFSVDVGIVLSEESSLQNAIDAASLAAAQDLPDTTKATATANQYIRLNGYEPSNISITFSNSNNTINIAGSKEVPYAFARVLGLTGVNIYPRTAATKTGLGAAFSYALFSGNPSYTLTITGSGQYIGGNAHSNYKFIMTGSSQTITGSGEAVSQFSITGSGVTIGGMCEGSSITTTGSGIQIGSKVFSSAPLIDMLDFSDLIKSQAEAAGQVYNGNKIFTGSGIDIDSPIYVNGDVTITGSQFTGKGCILATGNITFTGSGLTSNSGDAVCFYSQNGNIAITGSSAVVDGILYAPKGTISITGSGVTVNGRVIADKLLLTGSSYRIVSGTDELKSLPSSTIKLTD